VGSNSSRSGVVVFPVVWVVSVLFGGVVARSIEGAGSMACVEFERSFSGGEDISRLHLPGAPGLEMTSGGAVTEEAV